MKFAAAMLLALASRAAADNTCACTEYRNGASAQDDFSEICLGPSESWGTPCYPKGAQGCNGDWTPCTEDMETLAPVPLGECVCDEYRNGASASDADLCMGPSESWGTPCYPRNNDVQNNYCNADWTPCGGDSEPVTPEPVDRELDAFAPEEETPEPVDAFAPEEETPEEETPEPDAFAPEEDAFAPEEETAAPTTPTPVVMTPVPVREVEAPEEALIEQDFSLSLGFGVAPADVTLEQFAEDLPSMELALLNITESVSVDLTEACLNDVECTTDNRVAAVLENGAMKVKAGFKSENEEKLTEDEFKSKVEKAIDEDLKSGNSQLREATPNSGAWDNMKPEDVTVDTNEVEIEEIEARAVESDDGLSGGAIAGIVVGSVAFVGLVAVAAIFMTKKSGGTEKVNEPVPDDDAEEAA